jgi:hypothetical protein
LLKSPHCLLDQNIQQEHLGSPNSCHEKAHSPKNQFTLSDSEPSGIYLPQPRPHQILRSIPSNIWIVMAKSVVVQPGLRIRVRPLTGC